MALGSGSEHIEGASPTGARAVHGKVAAAVDEMQRALQSEFHKGQKFPLPRLKGLVGRGGFGTVYRGACAPGNSCMKCAWLPTSVLAVATRHIAMATSEPNTRNRTVHFGYYLGLCALGPRNQTVSVSFLLVLFGYWNIEQLA